jgi:hypothetical protein
MRACPEYNHKKEAEESILSPLTSYLKIETCNAKYMKTTILCLLSLLSLTADAQTFEHFFADSTLRLDYVFAGDASHQHVYLDKLNMLPRWYGKKKNLGEVPVDGNGQIVVRDHRTGTVIYRNSFSTLFQEWLSYDEAKTVQRSFENVFLVPMPRDTVDVSVMLMNNRREVVSEMTHVVTPSDILIRRIGFSHVAPYETLQQADDTTHCIHLAFVAEGYTEDEMPVFVNDAKTAIYALFQHEPFKSLRGRFNIIAAKIPSHESGTSEPSNHIWKSTALHSHFDTFYSDRYLTTLHLKDLHDCLAGMPYEHIIVLVNTEKYGGGGILNSYNLAMAHHPLFRQVVVHEFGHSFAGLADEYAYESEDIPMYPHDIEPWEPNITTLADFGSKWQDLLEKNTPVPTPEGRNAPEVGVYEGAGYSLTGVYRPSVDCRMRSNERPEFCIVCQRGIRRVIEFYTR